MQRTLLLCAVSADWQMGQISMPVTEPQKIKGCLEKCTAAAVLLSVAQRTAVNAAYSVVKQLLFCKRYEEYC